MIPHWHCCKADELRCRFGMLLYDRCKGKDLTKLRFVID